MSNAKFRTVSLDLLLRCDIVITERGKERPGVLGEERLAGPIEKMAHNNTNNFASQSKTQSAAILHVLISARGSWVPLPEILALGIAQYNARIFELRRLGFDIENRTERIDGVRHSWFRLVCSPAVETPRPEPLEPAWKDRRRVTGLPLFDLPPGGTHV